MIIIINTIDNKRTCLKNPFETRPLPTRLVIRPPQEKYFIAMLPHKFSTYETTADGLKLFSWFKCFTIRLFSTRGLAPSIADYINFVRSALISFLPKSTVIYFTKNILCHPIPPPIETSIDRKY